MASDKRFIQLAIQLAKRGIGQTGSNPSVGCVIVKNNKIIARSVTARGGRPHAETLAIQQAGNQCEGATLFVTLEPCSHNGQTPPCTQSIINSKIARVVCPLMDPDPRVSGRGFAQLKQANVIIDLIPSIETIAEEVIRGFSSRVKRGRPYVTVKLGTTLDGKIASANGKSQWITNSLLRARSHLLRTQNDAVLVGTNTFINDNPQLNVRGTLTDFSIPLRVFLDQNLKVFPSEIILTNMLKYPSVVVCGDKTNDKNRHIWESRNIELLRINSTISGLDLSELCEVLAIRGINSLLVEGGGKLSKSLLVENLIDELIIHQSGIIIGADGISSFADLNKADQEISAYPKLGLKYFNRYKDNLEIIWSRF